MKVVSVFLLALALAGCVNGGPGGSGQLSDGTPIAAKATTASRDLTSGFHYTLSSRDGLNCTGFVPPNSAPLPKPPAKMELDCGNGLTGDAVVTYGTTTNIVFKLSDGRQGSAAL